MKWKKQGRHAAIALSVSLGAVSAPAESETQTEILKKETRWQEGFDTGEVEDKIFVSAKGHQVKLWRDGSGRWRADVVEDLTGIEHERLPVGFGDDWSIDRLMRQETSKYRLHVLLRGDLPENFDGEGHVYVGNKGLNGGMYQIVRKKPRERQDKENKSTRKSSNKSPSQSQSRDSEYTSLIEIRKKERKSSSSSDSSVCCRFSCKIL